MKVSGNGSEQDWKVHVLRTGLEGSVSRLLWAQGHRFSSQKEPS
jgi:hypothetical protein